MISKLLNWLGIKRTKSITIIIKFEDDVPDDLAIALFKRFSELITTTLDKAIKCSDRYDSQIWNNIKDKIKY